MNIYIKTYLNVVLFICYLISKIIAYTFENIKLRNIILSKDNQGKWNG